MTEPMIRLNDLVLTYSNEAGPVEVLRRIELDVRRGETVSVVGPSGSGKSSMMMVMAGLERATSGTVGIDGTDLGGLDEDALARFRGERIGIVFQDFHLIPTMSALENVAVPLELAGRRDAFEQAAETLQQVGLDHRLTHYPGQLSGGEQQRVALARAFAVQPRLLLADEPTGNLDGNTGEKVIELLFDLVTHQGTTLVLITHDPSLAQRCSRTVRLADGQIVDDGTISAAAGEPPEPQLATGA
ncbi:ABC transporter ATP-binding protein [Algihabitans albus]|uniref:ABC transporter ATP-binding protein n=1 Tax=Algihabitans albus TaxID=2164067 RepID=UPI001F409485|nr:ABC transporter ATP-binding protein [Algihabitans albus]